MKMKDFLKKQIDAINQRMTELAQRSQASEDITEVRSINTQLEELRTQREEFQKQYDAVVAEEERSAELTPNPAQQRGFNPMASFGQGTPAPAETEKGEERTERYTATMEYRKAFMDYVQNGRTNPDVMKRMVEEARAGGDEGFTIADDVKMLIPDTVIQSIIQSYKGIYGTIYAKVRKMNIKGGVKFPIGDFNANVYWINESTQSKRQKAGEVKQYIEFSYYMAEIRVANSLLSSVVTVDLFEQEIVRAITHAWLKEIDTCIINGDGNGKPWGITKDSRVTNKITLTDEQFKDWKAWRELLFAKIPLGLRGGGEFIFPVSTVETKLATMKDDVDRPLYREAVDLSLPNSGTTARFYGRTIQLVEPDIIPDFDTAKKGEVIGVLWNPSDYVINTNMQFAMRRYFDEETNQYVNKALVILDGKIVDTKNCYLLIKG